MSLILALILIAILCAKVSSDKAAVADCNRRIDAEMDAFNRRRQEWVKKVYDVDTVYDVTKMVERREKNVEQEVSSALEEMILIAEEFIPNNTKTEQTVRELTIDKLNRMKNNSSLRYMGYCSDPKDTSVRIMLANRGKMRNFDALAGITWSSYSSGLWQDNAAVYYTGAVFAKWIDERLKEHGINETLYWGDGVLDGYELDDQPHLEAASFLWEPSVRIKH